MTKPRDAKGYTGSTAWYNSARSRWFLVREEVGLTLSQPKVNYARAGSQVTLAWDTSHEVLVVTGSYDEAPNGGPFRPMLLRLIAEVQDEGTNISLSPTATNNPYKLIKDRIGFARGLERAALTQKIAAWRAGGLGEVQSYSQSNRSTGKRLVLTEVDRELALANPETALSASTAVPARAE
jgi:putative DNA primase/helicase